MPNVWFADCEVFAYDLIWVFQNKRNGKVMVFHNDTEAVEHFLNSDPDLWLCGYNFRDYDQYILKGTLLHYDNDQLKALNDLLIFGEVDQVWEYLGQDAWNVDIPPIIDLFHDIVPAKSLKEIEGNLGMKVVETGVSFDIERPLTEEELKIEIEYCKYDVYATGELYKHRLTYLKTKKTLCEMSGLDDAKMMMHTNARVVSEALHAERINPIETFGTEWYIDDGFIPDCIDFSAIPSEVRKFVKQINTFSGWAEPMDPVLVDVFGTPTIVGIGGIHACTGEIVEHKLKSGPRKGQIEYKAVSKPTKFETDDEHVILIQDIGSFYPSMMILFDFLSRAIPDEWRHLFTDQYELRMKAKHDPSLAEYAAAAKLVLNTVYGCMKNKYNKLYDPFMATCVCITGQLFILDLMNRIHERIPDFEIVQLNTDGWVLKIRKAAMDILESVINQWCLDTGFTVDTDIIKLLWQRDVNNYVMQFDNGKIKAKGGTVKNWNGGDFKSNSATIIDFALCQYMIENKPIEQTINECDDMERFQLILKAGGTYSKCCKVKDGKQTDIPGKVHRVYAVKDGYTFAKLKAEGGNPSRFPDSPENALEGEFVKDIDSINKQWYIDLANKKLQDFIAA